MTAWRACLGKIGRKETIKMFRIKIMKPDGSTIYGLCEEPRTMLQLPVDLRTLNDDEKRIRIAERRPAPKQFVEDIADDIFDYEKYISYGKRK